MFKKNSKLYKNNNFFDQIKLSQKPHIYINNFWINNQNKSKQLSNQKPKQKSTSKSKKSYYLNYRLRNRKLIKKKNNKIMSMIESEIKNIPFKELKTQKF